MYFPIIDALKENTNDLVAVIDTIEEDLTKYAIAIKNEYINGNGTPSYTANWTAYYFDASDLVRFTDIKTYSSSGGVGFYQLSFFNGATPSHSTLIDGVKFTAEGANVISNIDVPDSAVLCVVIGRTESIINSHIKGLIKTSTMLESVNDLIIPHLSQDSIINSLLYMNGVVIATDAYTGQKTASFTGTSSSKTWGTIKLDCEQCMAYALEFYGKSNDDSHSASGGALMRMKFLDANGNAIGSYYDSYVKGTQTLKYHRYGVVSPFGAKTLAIDFITRANYNMTIRNVTVNPVTFVPQRQRSGILLDGHLGMTYVAPKNTMPSFELGKIAGFNTMITNINVTSDGVLVALHDNTIDATSDGTGNVTDFTYSQLLEYDFGSWFNAAYTGTKIPKFEEVVAFLANSGIRLGVSLHHNLSNQYLSDMCEIIQKYYTTPVLIKSFYLEDVQYVQNILGDKAEYMWDGSLNTANIDTILALDFDVTFEVSSSYGNNENFTAFVNYALSNGVKLSCYFGDNVQVMKAFSDLGINRFCVNSFSDVVFPMQ